ncbi:MAG: efflux RND transporter periplasmic adaptor subunit [Planctomycetota bacterium]
MSTPGTRIWSCLPLLIVLVGVGWAYGEAVEGFAEPYRVIDVSGASEPDLITEILVSDGDTVTKNQVIAIVDTSVLEASLDIARRRSEFTGQLEAAQAELRIRRDRAEKLKMLFDRGHASPLEVERAVADAAIAAAQVRLAQEDRELAALECNRIQAQIERRRFRSPIDGVVTEVIREVGESVQISDPKLMTIVQLDPLRVKFPVLAGRSGQYAVGDRVTVGLPELSQAVDATVEMIAPVVDPKSGTVDVTCIIANDDGRLRSGMRCELGDDLDTQSTKQLTATYPN